MTTFSTTRYFAASPATLFEAIRNPERLVRWWGPLGFSNRFHAFDFQPGGEWRFDMIGPDGTVHPNESRFEHIEPERRVVIQHTCAPFFRLAITLEPTGDGTTLHWDQTFADTRIAEAVAHIVKPANEENLDRLGAEVTGLPQIT
jgi:uncharacterized protein YndB with AHSA1/START domain